MNLQQRIIIARQKKGLTQEELATLAKVSTRTIQRIESGESIPRSFTLKAIAGVLDQPYEQLLAGEADALTIPATSQKDVTRHFLQLFNLSCLSFIVIPWVHVLVPYYLFKKQNNPDVRALEWRRKIIRQQIYWTIALHLLMLITLAYNLFLVSVFQNRQYVVNYLWPFFIMYFLNAAIIIINASRIRKQF
jgi:transcriptional regulator with XRE-family HTH domain